MIAKPLRMVRACSWAWITAAWRTGELVVIVAVAI
jgi:hypothetical protein